MKRNKGQLKINLKTFFWVTSFFFTGLLIQNLQASTTKKTVFLAEIRGSINPASSSFLNVAIQKAENEKAEALIVELDTPGGLVTSVREMAQSIDQSKVPVVVYVTPAGASATSAGALLLLAAHVGAMAPGTNAGAAHPVDSSGKEIVGAMGEKVVNDTAAFARGLAELRGRNRELAESIVSKSKSLTSQEALNQNLIDVMALNREELLQKLMGRKVLMHQNEERLLQTEAVEIRQVHMTWGQRLLHFLANPNIATLLMTLGMLCLYVEITTPSLTVAGILGGIMLLVAFMSFQMLPIRLGGLLLLLLGLGLILTELFVATQGALAVGGVLSFILGILWVMDPLASRLQISPAIWIPAVLALSAGAALIATVAAQLKRRVKEALLEVGGGGASGLLGYFGTIETIGSYEADGCSGQALFRGELWNFRCNHFLKVGEKVVIEQVEGMWVQVRPVPPLKE